MTADVVLALVKERHQVEIDLEGRCAGGEVGAWFGRLPDGQRVVFKWSEDPASELGLRAASEALGALHDDGYPMPRYGPVLPFDGGVLITQRAVDGRCDDTVGDDLGAALLECRRATIGRAVPIEQPWGRFIITTLTHGAHGYAHHQPLRSFSAETRELLDWIEGIGHHAREESFPERDLVHFDFHHRNALQTPDGRLGAVVDWEGVRQGDSVFDLVTLAFGLVVADCRPGLIERVWAEAVEETTPEALTAYVAHMALRRLDWTIRFHPHETPFWLDVCTAAVRRVA